jgi:ABC-2 type transport system ATP-binding protein
MTSPVTFTHLVKAFGSHRAVDDLTATINPGQITGFLGPNGAGKSTTLRVTLGLARATSGSARVFGKPYAKLGNPLRRVGVVLDTRGFIPTMSGRKNLDILATGMGAPKKRIAEVLELVDVADAGNKPVKGYSLGMKQRLSLAAALLGDPELLILDEPANGLDPFGIAWLREFLRTLQAEGRTILVSSHQLAEMQNTIDDVIIINKGKLIAHDSLPKVIGTGTLEEAFLRLTKGEAA